MSGLLLLLLPLLLALLVIISVRNTSRIKAIKSVLATVWNWKRQPASIVVTDLAAARHLLVRGSLSNRPPSNSPSAVLSRRRYVTITSAPYGGHWRAMRHNLSSEFLHPALIHQYAAARRRALRGLVEDLAEQRRMPNAVVHAAESIHYAMFGLVATMCFGDGLDGGRVRAMADAQSDLVRSFFDVRLFANAKILAVSRLIYRNKWKKLAALRQKQEEMYLPLIDLRRRRRSRHRPSSSSEPPAAYVDTLSDLEVPDEDDDGPAKLAVNKAHYKRRRLCDGELVGMCAELLGAGSETTASAVQWIMANLVKHADEQEAVRREIHNFVAAEADQVGEEVLGKLEYLNAVIMEALRLHPPTSVAYRQVMEDDHVIHQGQRIPAGTVVYCPLAALARSCEDPDDFKPQRFLANGADVKMMPFGAGRRVCPGKDTAMRHVSYFVANLVREFVWTEVDGEHAVDLRPHVEFFTLMKRPLRAHLQLARPELKTN